MSEYQVVHFQAIDRPLNDKQLAYMRRQSTRAEISTWEFSNEYHFGDFGGDPYEMLRRGYDVHLHYANFGIRRLMFRLPAGLPWNKKTYQQYETEYGLGWEPDKKGPGGVLEISPEADAGTYDEDVYDFDRVIDVLGRVREMLCGGDLRPLYLAWLACVGDEDAMEPPVPAGLDKLPRELSVIAKFYEVSRDLVQAAAQASPPAPAAKDHRQHLREWVDRQPAEVLRELATRLLADPSPAARAAILARIRDEAPTTSWPTAEPSRTFGELQAAASGVKGRRVERERLEQQRARETRLKSIAAKPNETIARVKKLVKERSTTRYEEAAQELVDLREALGPKRGPARVQNIAADLAAANPTLNLLKSALRKHGLLPKR
jgi:hypothetical protein